MRSTRKRRARGAFLALCVSAAAWAHAACTAPRALVTELRIHPSPQSSVTLGNWYAEHQQFECAAEVFSNALKAYPTSAKLHYLQGLALVDGGHRDQAISAIQEAERLEPGVVKPHLLLGHLYYEAGRPENAEVEWKKALMIDPVSIPALEDLSAVLLARHDYKDTVSLLEHAPRTETLTINLAKAMKESNDMEGVSRVLSVGVRQFPDSMPLTDSMTLFLVQQHRYDDAIAFMRKGMERHPSDINVEERLYQLLVLTGHAAEARPMGPKLLALRPHDATLLALNGVVAWTVDDYHAAKEYLEEAVALDPNFADSQYNLGATLVALHEYAEAKEHLDKAISLGTSRPEVHYELARALRGLGESEPAQQEMAQFEKIKRAKDAAVKAYMSSGRAETETNGAISQKH